jgi:transposase InsO family protein
MDSLKVFISYSSFDRSAAFEVRRLLRTELVLEALNVALWRRRPENVIHHSDQGTQYTSVALGQRCKDPAYAFDGVGRRLLRQRDVRELLRHTRMRAARSHLVSDAQRGTP